MTCKQFLNAVTAVVNLTKEIEMNRVWKLFLWKTVRIPMGLLFVGLWFASPVSAAFPEGTVVDDFNRANESPATGWTENSCATSNSAISSNVFTIQTGANGENCSFYLTATTLTTPIDISVDIPTVGAGSFFGIALIQDPGAASFDGYFMTYVPGTGLIHPEKITNASSSAMGGTFTQTLTNGDKMGFRLDANGNFTYYVKDGAGAWTSIGTRTDSTFTGSFRIMLFTSRGLVDGGNSFDDIRAGTVPTSARRPIAPIIFQ
jgi:hypothetical protein